LQQPLALDCSSISPSQHHLIGNASQHGTPYQHGDASQHGTASLHSTAYQHETAYQYGAASLHMNLSESEDIIKQGT
jgi:hypothetical protein